MSSTNERKQQQLVSAIYFIESTEKYKEARRNWLLADGMVCKTHTSLTLTESSKK
jgi:hypothetical protein